MLYNTHEKEINLMARQSYQDAQEQIRRHLETIKMLQNHMYSTVQYLEGRHDISYAKAVQIVSK